MVCELIYKNRPHIISDAHLVVLMRVLLTCLDECEAPEAKRTRWSRQWSNNLANHVHGMLDLSLESLLQTDEDRTLFRKLLADAGTRFAAYGGVIGTAELNAMLPRSISFTKPVATTVFLTNIQNIDALVNEADGR